GDDANELPATDGQEAAGFTRHGRQVPSGRPTSNEEDDDMLTAMARELVTENGVGESANVVWRQIQAEDCSALSSATILPEPAPVAEEDMPPLPTSLVRPFVTVKAAVKALKFGTRPPSVRPFTRR